jgi:NAD(P)-dependent dehydrogenase (short-subunit alcohol dehydrogenase family)
LITGSSRGIGRRGGCSGGGRAGRAQRAHRARPRPASPPWAAATAWSPHRATSPRVAGHEAIIAAAVEGRGLDILISSAGIGFSRDRRERRGDVGATLDINLKAPSLREGGAAAPSDQGNVVNIASDAGLIGEGPVDLRIKGGVVSLTRAMALELAPASGQLRLPGYVDTCHGRRHRKSRRPAPPSGVRRRAPLGGSPGREIGAGDRLPGDADGLRHRRCARHRRRRRSAIRSRATHLARLRERTVRSASAHRAEAGLGLSSGKR